MFKINIRENPAYFKDLLKLIKQFTSTPLLTSSNGTATIKSSDKYDHFAICLTLYSNTNKFNAFLGAKPQQTSPVTVTFDLGELLKSITTATGEVCFTNDYVSAGATKIKTYHTFKSSMPDPSISPAYSAHVNLVQFWDAIKEMQFLARMTGTIDKITIIHGNGDDTVTTKTIPVQNATNNEAKSIYSCTYLKQLTKSLLPLAETATISFAYDNPLVLQANLKYMIGNIKIYLAPVVTELEANP